VLEEDVKPDADELWHFGVGGIFEFSDEGFGARLRQAGQHELPGAVTLVADRGAFGHLAGLVHSGLNAVLMSRL